jgi:hypothetical protein
VSHSSLAHHGSRLHKEVKARSSPNRRHQAVNPNLAHWLPGLGVFSKMFCKTAVFSYKLFSLHCPRKLDALPCHAVVLLEHPRRRHPRWKPAEECMQPSTPAMAGIGRALDVQIRPHRQYVLSTSHRQMGQPSHCYPQDAHPTLMHDCALSI